MLITYLRNSTYNDWDMCQHKFYIKNVLGFKDTTNRSAILGNVVHKALEILALYKKAIQEDKTYIVEDNIGKIQTKDINNKFCIQTSFDIYKNDGEKLEQDDLDLAETWFLRAIHYNKGEFNPIFRDIVDVEKYFDIVIEEDWAKYDYVVQGKEINGYLSIKGTCDLIVKNKNGIEYIDCKTGKTNKCWATGKIKDYQNMLDDPQFLFYYYAISYLYPDIENVLMTVYFINAGGPVSVSFSKQDVNRCLEKIKNRFIEIKENMIPKWIKDTSDKWKCNFCSFRHSICDEVRNKIINNGILHTTESMIDLSKIDNYEGGGRK